MAQDFDSAEKKFMTVFNDLIVAAEVYGFTLIAAVLELENSRYELYSKEGAEEHFLHLQELDD